MARIVGCVEAHELTTCKQGANQHAHIIMRKSLGAPSAKPTPQTSSESDDMDFAILKAMLAMDETTKAYASGLDEEALKLFVAKSAADQKAEAHAAAKVLDDAAKAEEARKKALEATETETQKALREANDKIASLEARDAERNRDRELDKEAGMADFDGYPGGLEAVKAMLKSIDKLEPPARKAVVDSMKSQATLSKKSLGELGGRTEEEINKAAPKMAAFVKKRAEIMTEKAMTQADATRFIATDPALKRLYEEAMSES